MYSNYHNEYVLVKLLGFYPPSLCVNYDHKEKPEKINLIVRNDLFLFLRVTLTSSDACVGDAETGRSNSQYGWRQDRPYYRQASLSIYARHLDLAVQKPVTPQWDLYGPCLLSGLLRL